ncbi:hypothetical protein [Polyangium sp. 6x1]|uniref:hypothetical protein n=1 Tax=Polyangium sp. 6x1 TaxID=3042689 RepID=UPI00248286EF|nr:hypothetical protein [Polyangium sp. 6x1]MDI1445851.1 hypothetical protein [Polyangium sp. 6x1]
MGDAKNKDTAKPEIPASLSNFLADASLTEGQRRRIALFRSVENAVCSRIEQICVTSGLDVVDVAVLVVDVSAHELFFQDDEPVGTCVLIGHRDKVHAFLRSALPPAEDAPFDPYEDLRTAAPARCVRVMIVDQESLTVMSYGTFVTVRLDASEMPEA